MNKFPGFYNIKTCYEWGCYTRRDIADYVKLECITVEEYQDICGEPYDER